MAQVNIRTELLDGALADSVHDFKIPNTITKNKDGVTLGDVFLTLPDKPTGPYTAKSEHDMLRKIFKTDVNKNPIRELIGKIAEEKKKGKDKQLVLDVDGLEKFSYKVNYLSYENDNNMRSIKGEVSLGDYATFFNLDKSPLNIVIDAQSIGIKKIFSYAKNDGTELVINSIINREVINDPASKIYDVSKFTTMDGLRYNILREDNKENIKYTSFETPDNPLLRNKFYSDLDLTLSPLLNVKKAGLPRITLDILNKKKELIYQTGNPHLDNAISSCWNLIKKWFGSLTDKHIRSSSFFQCKRSGDWLQALSCIDIDRPYINDLDNTSVLINNIKLVTLDQILLWYSLIIGIDVIFTCTIPADNAADVEETEDTNDGNDDDELESSDATKPKKILLYFTRSNPEPPEEKLIRYKSMAKKKADINYNEQINKYNSLIQEVVKDIEVEIDAVFNKVINDITNANSLTKNIMIGTKELLQLNWKLTALDYKELNEPVKPADIDQAKIEELSLYISQCSSIDSVIQKSPTKGDLVFNSKAYEINEEYLKLIDPFFVFTGRGIRGSEDPNIRCAKSCSYLKFRLPDSYIKKLSEQLTYILDLIKIKWPKATSDNFAIAKIISILRRDNMNDISDIIVKYLKEVNTVNKIKATQTMSINDATAAALPPDDDVRADDVENAAIAKMKEKIDGLYVEPPVGSDIGSIEDVAKYTQKWPLIGITTRSGTILGKIEVVPKIKRAMTSGNEDYTEYGKILLSLLGEQTGGGPPSKDKSVYAYILLLIYLNSLINTLNGYEMMNGSDYMYFDAVARIVISAIQVTNTDHLSVLDTIYIEMLDTVWVDEFTSLESKDFKECVQVAAQNLALQSLNLRRGPMPYDTYKGSKKIFEDIRFDSEFKKITSTLKDKSFYDRKLYLISRIERYIKSSVIPSSRPPVPIDPTALSRVVHEARDRTPDIYSSIKPSKEALAGLAIGGSKTRVVRRKKRKNGSPRRKTLRKTRRHR